MTKSSSTKRLISKEIKAELEDQRERVFKIVNRKIQDKNISDDLFQNAYHQTLARLERTDLEPVQEPVGLLIHIAATQTKLYFRNKEQRAKRINSDVDTKSLSTSESGQRNSGDHDQTHKQYLHMMQLAKDHLSDAEIQLLHLKFKDELTFQQVADAVESFPSTVEYQIKSVLKRLKELEQKFPFPERD